MNIKENLDKLFEKVPGGYFSILLAIIESTSIIIASILFFTAEPFSFFTHYISNLGGATTNSGILPNGSNIIFSIGLILSAICASIFIIYLNRILASGNEKNPGMVKISLILSMISVIGIVLVALFDMKTAIGIHTIGAMMFFVGGMFMILSLSITFYFNTEISKNQAYIGLGTMSVFAIFLGTVGLAIMDPSVEISTMLSSTSPSLNVMRFWEWMVLFAILLWFTEIGVYTIRFEKRAN